jgi:NAD(P)-dependent dehydrogenase (short-subunit alcohol dehydrogenase family)
MLAYSASKFGVVGLTKTAARDLAQFGIRVNALSPDLIESGMWPTQLKGQIVARAEGDESAATDEAMVAQEAAMKAGVAMDRLGSTAELAGVVSFLLSDDSSYMTGKNMEVDGGRL